MRPSLRKWLAIPALAACYFYAGKIGLSWAHLHASVSPVWPPAGIALAALLLWGDKLWPGVFLGTLLINFTLQGTALTNLGIAVGSMLEALVAVWAINRFANGAKAFERARHIVRFVLIAPVLSTAIGATFGVASLTLTGFAQWNQFSALWLTWWLGDGVGDLIFAPLMVIWLTQPRPQWKPKRVLEAAGLLAALILIGYFIFIQGNSFSPEYIVMLPLLWAAFRFDQRGAVTSALILSAIALLGTFYGVGPYTAEDPNESLLSLQAFMGTLAIASLVLAAVTSENKRAEQRLEVQGAISRILVESAAINQAVPQILQVLGQRAGWDLGAVWIRDPASGEVQCVDVWHVPDVSAPEFKAATKEGKVTIGAGLSGQVLSTGKAFWIADVAVDHNFRRAPLAMKEGLHGALGFPIKLGDEILGVVECFSRETREPDDHFLEVVGDIGGQLGQFIERKRAEDDLRARRSQLRAIANITPVMLAQCSRDLRYTFVNRAYAAMLERAPEEIIGKPIVEIIGTKAFATIRPHVETVLQGQPVEYEAEIPYNGAGNRFVSVAYMPDTDAQGDVCGWIASISDITERKRANELLRQAGDELVRTNEQLERRVQERTADLEQANTHLVRKIEEQKSLEEQLRQAQKMEIIGTLAGGIAHDFNNILNIIRGYATLMGQQLVSPRSVEEGLKVIEREIDRGAAVVRQLLTVARKTETHLVPTNVNDIVLTLSDLIKTFPKTITVSLDLDSRLMPVLADQNQMSQALLNICVNARDAMPAGGRITIRTERIDAAETRKQRISSGTEACAGIIIDDTGMGMEEEVRARIFEPFFTTKGVGAGTGLGLAIVYGIVKEHHGFIDVESTPGRGTTFRLYLPMPTFKSDETSTGDKTTKKIATPQNSARRRGTVLVVEDEEALVHLLKKLLPQVGYQVLAAMDGQEALDLYHHHKGEIDIVLLDLGLPKVTGLDVIPKLKEQNPGVSIVIATGYLEPELKSELLRAGVKECIHKPYLVNDVLEKLGTVLESA